MRILGIETSCDETAASVVEVSKDRQHVRIVSSVTATSLTFHAKTGGIIPEIAARNQIKDIIPVIYEALSLADGVWPMANEGGNHKLLAISNKPAIDAIAVTYGPGLIGSLLVGVETAKTLSYAWNIPLIPINHLFGHLYANWLTTENLPAATVVFPAIGLIVSGGHTDLLYIKDHTHVRWLGGTRDDAAGEAFDKIGRMLGLAYPAGPKIEELAKRGNPQAYHFPRPLMHDKAWDFSFSGLKTAVLRAVEKSQPLTASTTENITYATQEAIIAVIVYKTLQAAKQYGVQSIILGGGVAANQTLTETFKQQLKTTYKTLHADIFVPQKSLCTDNAAMIAAAAVFQGKETPWQKVIANPELYFD